MPDASVAMPNDTDRPQTLQRRHLSTDDGTGDLGRWAIWLPVTTVAGCSRVVRHSLTGHFARKRPLSEDYIRTGRATAIVPKPTLVTCISHWRSRYTANKRYVAPPHYTQVRVA